MLVRVVAPARTENQGGFRGNAQVRKGLAQRKRRIEHRLVRKIPEESPGPILASTNAQDELADRERGIARGGIGLVHCCAHKIGLIDAIDQRVRLLKFPLPHHESDDVLNIADNALMGGTCLDDTELRGNDEVHLDALGADHVPDPTTAGDLCRRFDCESVEDLQCAINEVRQAVWKRQQKEFFAEAITSDMDGSPCLQSCLPAQESPRLPSRWPRVPIYCVSSDLGFSRGTEEFRVV